MDAEMTVEITRAETQRFRAALLFIHGLWTGSWLWARMAGYLGHRGWDSWAVDLPRRPQRRPKMARRTIGGMAFIEQCEAVARAMPAVPILVGHDTGATVALCLAVRVSAPAVVLVAPVLPGYGVASRVALAGGISRALAALVGCQLDPPTGSAAMALLEGADQRARELLRGRLVPEAGRAAYDLLKGRLDIPHPEALPAILIVGGAADMVTPGGAVTAAARDLRGELALIRGGHWLPIEQGWADTADLIHSWIVRTLGDPLLLLRDDDDGQQPS